MNERITLPPDRLPGMTRLAIDYLQHAPRLLDLFAGDYSRPEDWAQRAGAVLAAGHAGRRQVVEILRRQNQALAAGDRTMVALQALESDDALVIVTGQQAGLFGGPLYTLYKALTACKLAHHWTRELGWPVLPVFYVVSEDHDFAEVQCAGYLGPDHHFTRVCYAPTLPGERIPVGEIVLEEEIAACVAELTGSVFGGEFKAEISDRLAACYRPGGRFARAFLHWYAWLLQDQGMIFLDPADPELKRLGSPILQGELEGDLTARGMQAANTRLQAMGYHQQLPLQPQRPSLMLLRDGRHGLERVDGGWRNLNHGEILTLAELAGHPEKLSPKAALRPLFEDYLLPTLAYVGGPGEIAYWAQLKQVYAGFNLPMPLVVPRAGFTLVEGKSRRALERFALDPADLLADPETALTEARERLLPAELAGELVRFRNHVTQSWPALLQAITALDATLQSPAEKTLQQMLGGLHQLEHKVTRAAEEKQSSAQAQLQALTEALLPGGVLQERQLNAVPFLCRHGRSLIERLYQSVGVTDPGHQVLAI